MTRACVWLIVLAPATACTSGPPEGTDFEDDSGDAVTDTYADSDTDTDTDSDTHTTRRSLGEADASYTGEVAGDEAGHSVAGLGDVNGDGYGDVLIGAPGNDDGDFLGGAAYLVLGSGSISGASLTAADAQYTGESNGAGFSVAGPGDVNGDGYADLLVGAWSVDEPAAFLVLGSGSPSSAPLASADAMYNGDNSDFTPTVVAGAGDVNGDGFADLLFGAYGNCDGGLGAGAAYLVLGSGSPSSAPMASADAQYTGEAACDLAGVSVAGAGDVDGDGYADLLIGASDNDDGGDDAGAAYLVLGSRSPSSTSLAAADAKYTGAAGRDYAGASVAGAGHVNGDEYADILVGAYQNDDGGAESGAAYLILGSGSPSSTSLGAADTQFMGEAAYDYAGWVSGAGDVDADGLDDILVGADGRRAREGAAYIVLGPGI